MTVSPDVLRRVPYFGALDPAALRDLAARVSLRECRRGETLVYEGERCDGLGIVVRGRVKVFKVSPDGREHVLKIIATGHTFNDVPVFDGGPNPASVAALEPSVVGLLPVADVLALVDGPGGLARAALRVMAGRLRAMTIVVEDLAFRGVVARVARVLADCARGRSALVEGAAGPCATLTQQELAAMTGTVREVVQRALKVLEREGAIRMERAHVVVLDVDLLETFGDAAVSPA